MTNEASLVVSVSGIRGIVGRGLTPEIAGRFAQALGSYTGGGKIVVSRDGRPNGIALRQAVVAGLINAGCSVEDLGIVPTPTCGFAIRHIRAAGGIQITASHNPAQWNGLKLFNSEGRVLPASEGSKIKDLFEKDNPEGIQQPTNDLAKVCAEADTWHRERILQLLDVQPIRRRKYRVFLDANGGAGGPAGQRLLGELGCEVICRGCAADGIFLHEPEPTAENLLTVSPRVAESTADIGFVLDPDADRLALIDETGRYIGEELTLALALEFRLAHERGPVVVNMSTSRLCEDIAGRAGCPFYRSAVGEANVVDKMQQVGALIGGEGNGGVIDPRVGYVRDPFIGMGLILSLMATTGKKLSELTSALPAYFIVKEKWAIDRDRLPQLLRAIESYWPEATVDRTDGLRLHWPDRWIHIRPSNTEPIVRVIAEAREHGYAAQLCRQVRELLCWPPAP